MTPMTQAQDQQTMMLLHTLKGCPINIIMALILYGRLTGRQLSDKTGYSEDTINGGLRKLASLNIAYQVDKFRGWKLGYGIKQLSPILTALLGSESGGIIEAETRRNPEILGVSPLLTTTNTLREEKVVVSKNTREETPEISGFEDNPGDNGIQVMLISAGIGRNSRKLREILEQGHDPAYIQAHVDYYQWQQDQRQGRAGKNIDGFTRYTVGMLITRILARDPAPTVPQETADDDYRQYIPPELEGIIER